MNVCRLSVARNGDTGLQFLIDSMVVVDMVRLLIAHTI